VSVSAIKNGG